MQLGALNPSGLTVSQELRFSNPSSVLWPPSPHVWGEGENEAVL